MNKRKMIKQTEGYIRQLLQEEEDPSPARRAMQKLTEFFSTIDELEFSNHARVIHDLYSRPATANESILYVSLKHAVSERTLYRYRHRYIRCFLMYYQKELKNIKSSSTFHPQILTDYTLL